MNLEHSFTVPVGIDEAWKILLDIERIGPCMPGATIESVDGDDFTGSVKVKLGPIMLTYKGKASFIEKDEAAHRAVIDARGRDARGNGTAAAKITASLAAKGAQTTVNVLTDLDITGKPAQFGRGVMVDVGNKLIGQFADALAATISGEQPAAAPAKKAPAKTTAAAKTTPAKATPAKAAAAKTTPAKTTAAKAAPAKKTAAAAKSTTGTSTAATSSPAAESEPRKRAAPRPKKDIEPTPPPVDEPAAVEDVAAEAADAPPPAEATDVTDHAGDEQTSSANGHEVRRPVAEAEPIDLLASAGPAVAKRIVGPAAIAFLIIVGVWRRRRGKRA